MSVAVHQTMLQGQIWIFSCLSVYCLALHQTMLQEEAWIFLCLSMQCWCSHRNGSEAGLSHVASSRSLSSLSEGDASASSLIGRHAPHAVLISRGPAELAFRLRKEDSSRCVLSHLGSVNTAVWLLFLTLL